MRVYLFSLCALVATSLAWPRTDRLSFDASYDFSPLDGQFVARNHAQGLRLLANAEGVTVSTGAASVKFAVRGIGRENLASLNFSAAHDGRLLTYADGGLSSWYVNGDIGIEQGVTVDAPPQGSGPLRVAIAIDGAQRVTPDVHGLRIEANDTRLSYRNLHAWDALGQPLPARMTWFGEHVELRVDDAAAAYPITIDPVIATEEKRIAATSVFGLRPEFGDAIAIDGDIAVVGAPEDETLADGAGVALVLGRDEGGPDNWGVTKVLSASDPDLAENFGSAVAINGTTILVGAAGDAFQVGAAYVFERDQGGADNWGEVKKLEIPNTVAGARAGLAVALAGDLAIVGAPYADATAGSQAGIVGVFDRDAGGANNWGHVQTIDEPGLSDFDLFGHQLSVHGTTLAISAHLDDDIDTNAGAVYIYDHDGTNYAFTQKLSSADLGDIDMFGISVDLKGDYLAVGADSQDHIALEAGAAYLFVRNAGVWSQEKRLVASDAEPNGTFGRSVALRWPYLFVGAPFGDVTSSKGRVYVYKNDEGGADNWGEHARLDASDSVNFRHFGFRLAADADSILVSAAIGKGSVYWFGVDSDGDGVEFLDNCRLDSNTNQSDADNDGVGDVCDICPNSATNQDQDGDGVCSDIDNCPDDANPNQENADGDALGDVCDPCVNDPSNEDSDNDGVCGAADNCPAVANPDQADGDGDGVGDLCDPCVNSANNLDADADGVCDTDDNCPNDANSNQLDSDADTVGDICDACPFDANDDEDGDNLCANDDNCPTVANPNQADMDLDNLGDACDSCPNDTGNDPDNDGICAASDNCPVDANPSQEDEDADNLGDACDPCLGDDTNDVDFDGICGMQDNCPNNWNQSQSDSDGDGIGDACDTCPQDAGDGDPDADGWCNFNDNCPDDFNPNQRDSDFDGMGDECDICPGDANNDDSDGDGICSSKDNCPLDFNANQSDVDRDGFGDVCDVCPSDPTNTDPDADGICGIEDNCPVVSNPDQLDKDGDRIGDKCDINKTGDGTRGCNSGTIPAVPLFVLLLGLLWRKP